MPHLARSRRDGPQMFRVRFQGVLDVSWFAAFQSVTLSTTRAEGFTETTVVGEAPDEAALIGLINLLYELGCLLVSVEYLDTLEDHTDASLP